MSKTTAKHKPIDVASHTDCLTTRLAVNCSRGVKPGIFDLRLSYGFINSSIATEGFF